jgi:hypothetical protein
MMTYADVCWHMLTYAALGMLRMLTEARTAIFFFCVFSGLFSICLGGIAGDARATSGVCAQWAGAATRISLY